MRVLAILLTVAVMASGCSSKPSQSDEPIEEATNTPIEIQGEDDVDVETECSGDRTQLRVAVREPGGFGLSAARVSVLDGDQSGSTDMDGWVEFENVTAGPAVLRVTPAEDWYKITQAALTIREGCLNTATVVVPLQDGFLTPPHPHDAWKGRTSFELFRLEVDIDCLFASQFVRCIDEAGNAPGRIRFPEPVPVGTGWVNLTAEFAGQGLNPYIGLQLDRPQWTGATFRVNSGVPLVFQDDKYLLSDTPHASRSRWHFGFNHVGTAADPSVVQGPITFSVEVTRSAKPLTIDPPHPDYWGNRTSINLVDRELSWAATQVYANENVAASQWEELDEGSLVFPGAKEVRFTAWINETLELDQPVEMWYGMAEGRTSPAANEITRLTGKSADGVRYDWVIEVADHEFDNLYKANATYFGDDGQFPEGGSTESQWRFHLRPASVSQDAYAAFTGEADIHVVAYAIKG